MPYLPMLSNIYLCYAIFRMYLLMKRKLHDVYAHPTDSLRLIYLDYTISITNNMQKMAFNLLIVANTMQCLYTRSVYLSGVLITYVNHKRTWVLCFVYYHTLVLHTYTIPINICIVNYVWVILNCHSSMNHDNTTINISVASFFRQSTRGRT